MDNACGTETPPGIPDWVREESRRTIRDWRKRTILSASTDPKIVSRFWGHVDNSGGPDACWPWQMSGLKSGYGFFYISTFVKSTTHRFAYLVAHGEIPAGLLVRHKCDNPPCCNPAHLLVGTIADNNRDRLERGGYHRVDNRPATVGPGRGRRSPLTKLTADDVREIRRAVLAGETQKSQAQKYGVSRPVICHVVCRKAWAHVV